MRSTRLAGVFVVLSGCADVGSGDASNSMSSSLPDSSQGVEASDSRPTTAEDTASTPAAVDGTKVDGTEANGDGALPLQDADARPGAGGADSDASPEPVPTLEPAACREPEPALPEPQRSIEVADDEQLQQAMVQAEPGDQIVLDDGDYSAVAFERSGTEQAPIVIRAKNRGQAHIVDGQLALQNASHVVVAGLSIRTAESVKLTSCSHVRLTRNSFQLQEDSSMKWLVIGGADSHHNRVDHNLFEGKRENGNFITIDGSETQQSQHDRIDHNYFLDVNPRADNEKEAIRVGWSGISESSGFSTIECNLFEECNGDPEIVSVKSNDNLVRYNTIRRSQGTLSLRHGNRTRIVGNFILGEGVEGTGGIRVYGHDHQILNNHLQGLTGSGYDAPIQIDGGDVDQSGALNKHFRVYNALVAFNTLVDNSFGIELGANYEHTPVATTIANNLLVGSKNQLIDLHSTPLGEVEFSGNIAWAEDEASVGVELESTELRVIDPQLTQVSGLWWLSELSPARDAAQGEFSFAELEFDVQGQPRDAPLDVGADEYIEGSAPGPLTPADVGPNANAAPNAP